MAIELKTVRNTTTARYPAHSGTVKINLPARSLVKVDNADVVNLDGIKFYNVKEWKTPIDSFWKIAVSKAYVQYSGLY